MPVRGGRSHRGYSHDCMVDVGRERVRGWGREPSTGGVYDSIYTHTHTHTHTHTRTLAHTHTLHAQQEGKTDKAEVEDPHPGNFVGFVFLNSVFFRCIDSKPQSLAPKSVDQISLSGLSHIVFDRGLRTPYAVGRASSKKSDWPCPKSQPSLRFPRFVQKGREGS